MDLTAVMDEIASVATNVPGVRKVLSYPPADIPTGSSGYVAYPQSVDYDQAYDRGEDQFTDLPLVLLAGQMDGGSRTRDVAAGWVNGEKSVKSFLDNHAWTTCDHVQVVSAEFLGETMGGAPYLAVMFKCTVVGPGEDE